ncbi:bifunctional phosphatase PAP2/diacylglycerol kinase family protein [Phaeacidiphilus oryzae]|uniref:bifunctional phosphatase PAP2/diacylglycerol kinase family protein n=1 Tax=Phaeacidiphilus oryzae TaxID=348818 RepID=UPI0007C7505C|nr:bifunctional phosphatase PAP2/diacylglycerol kinase family protein [Phaeacidiphilus oryzae]
MSPFSTISSKDRRRPLDGSLLRAAGRLSDWDQRIFLRVAVSRERSGGHLLRRISRAADHGLLWWGCGAAMAAVRRPPLRRAAVRGLAALSLASPVANLAAKQLTGRQRPLLAVVPHHRHPHRRPWTSSFPSGHAASAAAFATGVALESPALGALVAVPAVAVAFSRVYVGVHYPGDVLAGAAIGVGAALATRHRWPPPPRPGFEPAPGPQADAPACPSGAGLELVVNPAAGPDAEIEDPAETGTWDSGSSLPEELREGLPQARVWSGGEPAELMAKAAAEAQRKGGALGVCGGDGTVQLGAAAALRHGVPLAVFPGGTLNHFAAALGIESHEEALAALAAGRAAAVDLGRIDRPGTGRTDFFLNTLSLGAYPEVVRLRDELRHRHRGLGKWPALAAALAAVAWRASPVEVVLDGRPRRLWLLFIGNCRYRPAGSAPVRRGDGLADGLLDVRLISAERRFSRVRALTALLTGGLERSPAYEERVAQELTVSTLTDGQGLAVDGEVAEPGELLLGKSPRSLVVYAPKADQAGTVLRTRPHLPSPRRESPAPVFRRPR